MSNEAKPLTDAELDAYPGVMDLLHGLCAITAPDGPLSREFYRDVSSTVIRLCTTIAELEAEAVEQEQSIIKRQEAVAVWASRAEVAEANQRTKGTIEVFLSCRESTLLWDQTKGVCGGGASRHMCPMMQALRAAKDAT
jgi:hypothetical protein